MSTFANSDKISSSHRTSNNYLDNDKQRDVFNDTDDVPSSEQSDVPSMVSEIATDTDEISNSEDDSDDSDNDCSSTDYSLSMDDAPHSTSISSNYSDSSNSLNLSEDSDEEMELPFDKRNFWCDTLDHGKRESLCTGCKLNRFIKVQTKLKCLRQLKRSISEIIKIIQ